MTSFIGNRLQIQFDESAKGRALIYDQIWDWIDQIDFKYISILER